MIAPTLRSTAAIFVVLAILALTSGCEPDGQSLEEDPLAPDPDLPEAVVDLPSPPPESAFEIREHNDDGSLRVEGLVANRDNYINNEVEVRGVVASIRGHDCTPGGPERCPRPHLLIRDHADDNLEMMVVGYENPFLRTASIEEGEDFLFRGTYTHSAHDFPSSEIGLIDLAAVDDHELEE